MEHQLLSMKLKNSFDKHQLFSLINVANIRTDLLSNNFVNSNEKLLDFEDKTKGIPILIPADQELFQFKKKDVFKIDKTKLLETIYGLSDLSYIGFQHSFNKFEFLSKFELKQHAENYVINIIKKNREVLDYLLFLKSKFKKIGAFQTRNIPHFGHEKIMNRMLENCDHLVINPLIGPKKKGDFTINCLNHIYNYLINNKYQNKLSFKPIFANMFYAGPREAFHHMLIRKNLGFDYFSVGRDHAGAQNAYPPMASSLFVKKNSSRLDISVLNHSGAFFCSICQKMIIKGDCNHSENNFKNVSGSIFRSSIANKVPFKYADIHMQNYLFESNLEVFEK